MKTPPKIEAFRKEFPYLKRKIYFHNGGSSIRPKSVVKASIDGLNIEAVYSLDPQYKKQWDGIKQETRQMAGDLIGAKPGNIAFIPNTSYGMSMISLALPWKKGDNVITGTIENPANVVPWQNLKSLGVRVRYLPADKDELLDLSQLSSLVDKNTRLVSLALVGYATGQRIDIKKVVQFCKPRGILVAVDAVQAVGAIPIDVKDLGVNFLCLGAQKWLLGPRNIGILYADEVAIRKTRAPIVTECNVADIVKEEVNSTTGIPRLYVNQTGIKFEAIPYMNFSGVFGFHRILKVYQDIGKKVIYQRIHDLTDELVVGLNKLDGRVVSPRGKNEWSGIVSFALNHASPTEVVAELSRHNVFVAVRKGKIRICPHFYNTSAEIQKFLKLLEKAMGS